MGLIVQKFGGTSVGSPDRIKRVAARIAAAKARGNQLVVVVSAMGHTTDDLIRLAHEVSKEPPHREMDMLLTAGERISMALLSMALSDLGVDALSFTGSQTGIITDQSHRRARIKRILGDRVRTALEAGRVAIVAGFQGVSETKEITTLGRGGSDTTAVALAAALKANVCEIYTDVDGVYSADPRVVKSAKLWKMIPHDLMVEMATRGAGVLHPRSVELAKQFNVRLCVRNSLSPNFDEEGTIVVSGSQRQVGMEEFKITGVTSDHDKFLIRVELARPGAVGSVLDVAAQAHLQMIAPCFDDRSAEFFAEREAEGEWQKGLKRLTDDGFIKTFELKAEYVPVSVIGDRFSQDGTALQQVLEVLTRNHISFATGSSSALAFTVGVKQTHADDAVRALHQELIESN